MSKMAKFIYTFFLMFSMVQYAAAQQKTLSGVVSDVDGGPLAGVNVTVDGTTTGTVTDFDGNYQISAESGQILRFSSVGFEDLTITVGDDTTMNVTLEEGSLLDEVVVIGFGTTRKEDLSTSVSSVKMDDAVKSGQADLNVAIQGRMPGVTFQSGGGDPLQQGTLSIRGRGSRGTDDDPASGDGVLFIVDGVPNAPFNVADIESISVLKDAASAAIYGANVGSGGVIEITTKQAKSGEARISFNTFQGFKQVANLPGTLTASQYNDVWARAISDMAPGDNTSLPMVADPNAYPYGTTTRTDWLDEIFRSAYQQHYDFNITGGTEQLKALGSFAYDKNEGTLINTYSEKLNARMNVNFAINDWLSLSEDVNYEHSKGQGGLNNNTHEGIIMNAVFYPRSATIYEHDKDGNRLYDSNNNLRFGGTIPQYLADQGVSGFGEIRNPVASLLRLRQYRPNSRVMSTSKLRITPLEDLEILSRYTASIGHMRDESFGPRILEIGRPDNENQRTVSSTQDTNWEWETTATYERTFGRHKLDGLVGFTMNERNYRFTSTSMFDFAKEDPHSTIFPSGDNFSKEKPEEEIWDESKTSVFGRVGYSFANRYFLTASLRRDATSKLFKNNNSGTFPSISGSWKISSEPFFENIRENLGINMLKVRGSWGQIGNISLVPRYSYDAPLAFPDWPYILGQNLDNEVYGVYQRTLSNTNLKWETTEQTGVGLDLTLFRSLDFSVDYFHKTTKDLIEQLPPPSVAGVEIAPYANVGKVLNKGWEFSLSYSKNFGDFDMNLWGNLNTVKNTVQDFGEQGFMQHDVVINGQRPLRSKVGEPWYSYYLIETDGIFQTQDEIDNYVNANGNKIQPDAVPGDLKFIDHNGDGKINDDDKVYMGSYLPRLTYAFGANFNYRNFDLSVMFQGIAKVKVYNAFKMMGLNGRDAGNNMLSDVLDSWNFNKDSGMPRLSIAGDRNENFTNASDYFLESGSYLRLKDLTIGYTFTDKTLSSVGLNKSSLRVYFNAQNLLTITPYTGIDPEVGNFGIDGGTYPLARSFSLGLNLNL